MNLKKILATVVTILMMLSSMGIVAFAEGTTVAKIGDTPYASLAEAISDATAGDTITLVADAYQAEATVNKAVTIDLGGNEITDAYIIVTADVTIKNGDIKNTTQPYPLVVKNGGKLTVNGIDIEASKSDRAIWVDNNSSLVFESGSILATKGNNNSNNKIYGIWVATGATVDIKGGTIEVDGGENATAVGVFGNYPNTVTMSGGKISTSGSTYSYGIWTSGDVTFSGGEIATNEKWYGYSNGITYGKNYAIYTTGDVTISGGKITTNGPSGYLVNGASEVTISDVEFTNYLSEEDISGGHSAPYLIYGNTTVEITGGSFKGVSSQIVKGTNATATISGGTFENAPNEEYLAEGVKYDSATGQVVTPPTGKIEGTLFNISNPNLAFISIDLRNVKATNEIKIELYDENDTLLATTIANQKVFDELSGFMPMNLTPMMCITGSDSYWTTTWEENMPRADYAPAYATLYLDGTKINSANVNMSSTSGEYSVSWSEVPGVNPVPVAAVAKIGDTGYETVAAALAAAQAAGMQNVEITLVGETTKESAMALKDMFNLYSTTQFDSITVKQENASTPYYINELQTGSRNNGGNFIFDGVNIVVVDQYIFEGNVKLTNNSVIKSVAEANCFIYNGKTTVEPGSKLQGVIEDLRGGELIIDGGREDGEFNTTPDMQDAILVINWSGDSITLNNGAYLKVNSANEVGRMTVNSGTELNINDSKLDLCQWIDNNGTINIDAGSLITTPQIKGAGVININASGMKGKEVQIIKANMSGFTGKVNINGNADYAITDTGIVLTAKSILQNALTSKAQASGLVEFSGETGGIKWCSYSFLVNMNGQSSISATVSVNGNEKPLQTKNNWDIGANIDGNTAFGVVVTGVDAVDSITVDVQ